MNYIVYDSATEQVQRTGICAPCDFNLQANEGQTVIEGQINVITQKIRDGKIVDKSPAEIEASIRPKPNFENQRARITNKELADIVARLDALEAR